MKILSLLFAGAMALAAQQQEIRLEPGEYRWIPLTVKQIPTEVAVTYRIAEGEETVHAELVKMQDFRLMVRGREHESLAVSRESNSAEFRRIVDFRGQYAAVIINRRNAAGAVLVSFDVRTEVDPSGASVAQTLPAGRKLTVILISFGLFFATVVWAGAKLRRAVRES